MHLRICTKKYAAVTQTHTIGKKSYAKIIIEQENKEVLFAKVIMIHSENQLLIRLQIRFLKQFKI